MQNRRAVLMETMQKINGAPRMVEDMQRNGVPARKTACGNVWCECSRIMTHLDLIKTPYFTVNNPDKRRGPTLPDEFVQDHGHEAIGNVLLDSSRTAGKILAVEFVKEEDEETGELKSIRIGQGWESFMLRNQLQAEDLLFFTLQGQSRFIVMMIRGHSRKAKEQAKPAAQKGKRKHKLCDIVDDDLEEGTAELWRAAKKHKGPAHPVLVESSDQGNDTNQDSSVIIVTCITSDDALGSYRLLCDSEMSARSEECSDLEVDCEDCSDFEDEGEFRRNRYLFNDNQK